MRFEEGTLNTKGVFCWNPVNRLESLEGVKGSEREDTEDGVGVS